MNRILFETKESDYLLSPRDPRFEHVRGVLRMKEGDSCDVGVINGPAGKATLERLDKGEMKVSVEWGEIPPPPPPVYLLVGLCRPATARKILTTVPTLGVRGLLFARTARSDPAYARSSLWTAGEWRQRLIEGCEQAFDTFLPELSLHEELGEAVEQTRQLDCRSFALDVYEGSRALSTVEVTAADPVCLAIGPERGWDANDRAILAGGGFKLVSLNQRVLRVENAVTVGLTLVLQRMGIY